MRHVVPHYSVQGQRFGRVFARGGVRVGQSVQVAAARVDGDQLPVGIAGRNEAPQQRVAGIVDNRRRVGEQVQFLFGLFFRRVEILLMGVADVRDDADVGTDDPFERLHLALAGDTRFDHGDLLVARGHQQRQRYADLRVVAFRTAEQFYARRAELGDPLFGDGLAVAAGDGYHFAADAVAEAGGQPLQRRYRIVAADESGFRVASDVDGAVDDEGAHSLAV